MKKPLIVHKKYWMPMQKNMLQFVSSCQRRRRYRTMIGNGIKKWFLPCRTNWTWIIMSLIIRRVPTDLYWPDIPVFSTMRQMWGKSIWQRLREPTGSVINIFYRPTIPWNIRKPRIWFRWSGWARCILFKPNIFTGKERLRPLSNNWIRYVLPGIVLKDGWRFPASTILKRYWSMRPGVNLCRKGSCIIILNVWT